MRLLEPEFFNANPFAREAERANGEGPRGEVALVQALLAIAFELAQRPALYQDEAGTEFPFPAPTQAT